MFKQVLFGVILSLGILAQAETKETRVIGVETPIQSINPFTLSGIDTFYASGLVIEPLARVDNKTSEITPVLAESIQVSRDKLKYRIKIRQGVLFHDGSPLTAEDVKFTYDAFMGDQYDSKIWHAVWESFSGVTIIDPYTVEFAAKTVSYRSFVSLLEYMRIVSKKFYFNTPKRLWNKTLVGTGPYVLKEFHPNTSSEFELNTQWWNRTNLSTGAPKRLIVKTILNPVLGLEMFQKGDLDFFPLTDFSMYLNLKKKKNPPHIVEGSQGGTGFAIVLNLQNPILKSQKVREALVYLWNRKLVNQKIFDGEMSIAIDGFDESIDFYPPGEPFPYDTKKAASLLASDGWKDSNSDGLLDKMIDGKNVDLAFTVIVCEPQTERWISLFVEDAKKLGVHVSMQRMPDDGQLWKRMQTHKFDAVGATGLGIMIGRGYRSDSFYNFYGYNNPKIDALLDRLDPEFDIQKRKKIDRRMIEIVRQDRTKIPGLFFKKSFYLVAPDLEVSKKRPSNPTKWSQN